MNKEEITLEIINKQKQIKSKTLTYAYPFNLPTAFAMCEFKTDLELSK